MCIFNKERLQLLRRRRENGEMPPKHRTRAIDAEFPFEIQGRKKKHMVYQETSSKYPIKYFTNKTQF